MRARSRRDAKSTSPRSRMADASIACSDMHYGNRQNLTLPGPFDAHGRRLGDEAPPRSRARLVDRSIGSARDDRAHRARHRSLQGQRAGRVMVEAADVPMIRSTRRGSTRRRRTGGRSSPSKRVEPHARHRFDDLGADAATHVRLNIYPDGGVARLRVFGRVAP